MTVPMAVADLLNLVNPQLVVVGGELAAAGSERWGRPALALRASQRTVALPPLTSVPI